MTEIQTRAMHLIHEITLTDEETNEDGPGEQELYANFLLNTNAGHPKTVPSAETQGCATTGCCPHGHLGLTAGR